MLPRQQNIYVRRYIYGLRPYILGRLRLHELPCIEVVVRHPNSTAGIYGLRPYISITAAAIYALAWLLLRRLRLLGIRCGRGYNALRALLLRKHRCLNFDGCIGICSLRLLLLLFTGLRPSNYICKCRRSWRYTCTTCRPATLLDAAAFIKGAGPGAALHNVYVALACFIGIMALSLLL